MEHQQKMPDSSGKMFERLVSLFAAGHVTSSMIERRRYPRIAIHDLLKYTDEDRKIGETVTNSRDISEGGVRFVSNIPFPSGTVLFLKINLYELGKVFDVKVRIAWSTEVNGPNQYYHGGEFFDLQPADKDMLHHLVYQRLSRRKMAV